MRKLGLLVATLVVLASLGALAHPPQPQFSFLSIPASGFTGGPNSPSGTAMIFSRGLRLFAPVNLPHGARVIELRCGGVARGDPSSTEIRIVFTLRRNEPQQANVDMATMATLGNGFQFVSTNSITEPVVNNETFNYYIVAELEREPQSGPPCGSFDPAQRRCSVGFCRIEYISNQ
jgi:hypothetical protein